MINNLLQKLENRFPGISKKKFAVVSLAVIALISVGLFSALTISSISASTSSGSHYTGSCYGSCSISAGGMSCSRGAWCDCVRYENGKRTSDEVKAIASPDRFLKKYPGGISRSYELTRIDKAKLEINVNIKNAENPSDYSFDAGTKVKLTAEIGLSQEPREKMLGNVTGSVYLQIFDNKNDCIGLSSLDRQVELSSVIKGETISGGGQYLTKTFDYTLPKISCKKLELAIYHSYRPKGRAGSACTLLFNYPSTSGTYIYLDSRSATPFVPKPSPTPTPKTSQTPRSVCWSTSPIPSSSDTVAWTIKPGWNTIIVPGELVDVDSSEFFREPGLDIYDFNLNAPVDLGGKKTWYTSTYEDHSKLESLHRRYGYEVYSKLSCPVTVTAKKSSGAEQDRVVIRHAWNLLANSSGQDVKFSEMRFRAIKYGSSDTCTENIATCSEEQSIADLLGFEQGRSSRILEQIYIFSASEDSHNAFIKKPQTVTKDNYKDVTIPANSVFWLYLGY